MIEGKKILITGGAGFIGSTLAARLLARNRVTVLDTFQRDALTSSGIANDANLTIVKGDVLDTAIVDSVCRDADIVVHCAAIAGIDTVVKKPVTTMRVNMIGSANVLEAVARHGKAERVVCFSTSEVFGTHGFKSLEVDRTMVGAVGEARWTYAVSKLAEEHLAYAYHSEQGLPTVCVRPFNVYGPGQVGEGAMRGFVLRALRNETLQIHGDGTQIRAWCYVDDMVEGVMLALSRPEAIGQSFNIGNQRAVVTIYGLASAIIRVLGSSSKIEFVWKDYADVELRVPSVEKARELLGFEAKVDLEEGIRLTGDFYRATL